MDWKTFIAEIISSLAWPALIAFILVKNKDQITRLIETLKTLKAGDFEFDFTNEIRELKEIEETDIDIMDQDISKSRLPTKYMITELWLRLENGINDFAKKNDINPHPNVVRTLDKLDHSQVIDNKDKYIILELRKIRNEAVHSTTYNPDISDVLEYKSLVKNLLKKLA